MKYSVSLIFVLALAAPLLSDCHAVPQYGIGPPLGAGSLYPDYDWTPPYDSEPSLGIGQLLPGNIVVPVDAFLPQLATIPNPNLGVLLAELLNLIASQLLGAIPLEIVNTPLNILGLLDYLNPVILPGTPILLSEFLQLLAEFLAEDLSNDIIALLQGIPINY